jgi:tetratricopeptide (TPR) repeat protein
MLAEAHAVLGMAYASDAQWRQSEKSFGRAIELDPSGSESYDRFAMFLLWPLGRMEEALQKLRIAQKSDPLSPHILDNLASALIAVGQYDEAASYRENLPVDYPGRAQLIAGIRLYQGRLNEAIQILETTLNQGVSAGSPVRGTLGVAYVRAGRREQAERLAAASSFNPFNQVSIFAALKDKERTFSALERATAAGPVRMGRVLNRLEVNALLRGDPRLKALRKEVGLPE